MQSSGIGANRECFFPNVVHRHISGLIAYKLGLLKRESAAHHQITLLVKVQSRHREQVCGPGNTYFEWDLDCAMRGIKVQTGKYVQHFYDFAKAFSLISDWGDRGIISQIRINLPAMCNVEGKEEE